MLTGSSSGSAQGSASASSLAAWDFEANNRIRREGTRNLKLRHTAASPAVAGGADVKVVQQMLGHASAP